MMEPWIQTFTGKRVVPTNVGTDDVEIRDIAHSLSLINRFTGHTPKPYSVAQHSFLVSCLCPKEFRLWGLLHDAPEAYISDISRPLKLHFAASSGSWLKDTERRVMDSICLKYNLQRDEPKCVKEADDTMLANEAFSFFGKTINYRFWHHRFDNGYLCLQNKIKPWRHSFSEFMFMAAFSDITENKNILDFTIDNWLKTKGY